MATNIATIGSTIRICRHDCAFCKTDVSFVLRLISAVRTDGDISSCKAVFRKNAFTVARISRPCSVRRFKLCKSGNLPLALSDKTSAALMQS